jgi:hypothetical protein
MVIINALLVVGSINTAQEPIVSLTTDSNSLVDAIRQYSDITDADVNKWKLLWLGGLNAVPALAIGGYSMAQAGEYAGHAFTYAQENKEAVPAWLQSRVTMPEYFTQPEPWKAIAALGAGYLTYKMFYPRIRMGVLSKVQNFIDVCGRLTIAQQQVNQFPLEWSADDPVAVCKALYELENQARRATILLNQVGIHDEDTKKMLAQVNFYGNNLRANKQRFSGYCNQFITDQQRVEDKALQRAVGESALFSMKLQNVKNVLSIIEKVGGFLYRGARDMVKWSVDNPAPATLMGMAAYFWKTSGKQ